MNTSPLKRKMLVNPSTGVHRGHPQPHPSQLTDKTPTHQSSPQEIDSAMQSQLDQAVDQLASSGKTPKEIRAQATPIQKPEIKDEPKKPSKPVVLPPKPKKEIQSTEYSKEITKDVASKIAEVPRSHIPTQEEIERIKKLNSFKPIIIGTVLFILGLVVSAIIAIIFELI